MKKHLNISLLSLATVSVLLLSGCGSNSSSDNNPIGHFVGNPHEVADTVIAEQRKILADSIVGKDVGAQSPRNINSLLGYNTKKTTTAPVSTKMNLCNIHFHKSAEHKGGEFTLYAGNGNGEGYGGGYKYSGTLTESELTKVEIADDHNPLYSGDTIEVHYVYTSDDVTPGEGLGACLSKDRAVGTQPLLRVETQVYVLVNDDKALDFTKLTAVTQANGFYQAPNIPSNTGTAVHYEGSTTGPDYNEKVSTLQVTWNVRPNIAKVNISTVDTWFHHNDFAEHHAHAVRNLVVNPELLSEIK